MSTMTGEVLLSASTTCGSALAPRYREGVVLRAAHRRISCTAPPEFADRFDEVYLWHGSGPNWQGQHDHGIDIVARDIHTGAGARSVQILLTCAPRQQGRYRLVSRRVRKKRLRSRIIVSTARGMGPDRRETTRRTANASGSDRALRPTGVQGRLDPGPLGCGQLPDVRTSGKEGPPAPSAEAARPSVTGWPSTTGANSSWPCPAPARL
ncbi:MAG: hypothetical protein IPJ15_15200 [Actinomycetales bacterium]|nr:hypothetical protein [Candidatus Phosphoribacter baldrii]